MDRRSGGEPFRTLAPCAPALLAFLGFVLPGTLVAQAPPLGPEFPVNTYTTGPQRQATAASRGNGTFVVVWADGYLLSRGIEGEDGSTSGIFGQRFSETGQKVGSDFLINTFTTGAQSEPAIAMNVAGNTAVVWKSPQDDPSAAFGSGIYGQRLDGTGSKVGGEFLVNTYTTGAQASPAVAMNASGGFVVVWASNGQDGSGSGIFGQRFDGAGAKAGTEFRVNTYTTGSQLSPSVAMDPAGDFVVVWESYQDGDGDGIFGQVFDFNGDRRGPEFAVNTYTTSNQSSPSVAMDRAGNFVVAFQSDGPDLDGFGVWARRYNSSAEALGGPEFQVNSYTTGPQTSPSVSIDRRGNVTIAWSSGASQDGFNKGVFCQRFDRLGFLLGSEFQVNSYTTDDQDYPRVFDDGAGFAAVWTSSKQDGDGPGVFARSQRLHPRSLSVDTQGIGITDLNGVLEPGEAAVVVPAWSNDGSTFVALNGTVPGLDGPSGPTYTLLDSAASYGSMPPNTLATCNDGNSNPCYAVQISGTRPATHWDASFRENLSVGGAQTWKLHLGDSFSDVPRSHPFYKKIETLLHNGVTAGCTTTQYCPSATIPRDQMGIFLAKVLAGDGSFVPSTGTLNGQAYSCSAGGVSRFSDVAPTDAFCKHVHFIAARNVTLGCGPTTYCPSQAVTRDAMASFIAKAIVAPGGGAAIPTSYTDPGTGLSYSCDLGSPSVHFSDVPASHPFCKHIHYLWAKGVISGCTATTYCPTLPVTRDAMAKFIANGFGLELYGP